MPRLPLPSLSRSRLSRRSTSYLVVGLVVVGIGTATTAVTAQLRDSAKASVVTPQNDELLGSHPAPVVTPTPKSAPLSTKPKHLISSTLLVSRAKPLTHRDLHKLRHVSGVRRTQTVTAGRATIDGHRAFAVGVNPQTFRPWTPKATADSNPLWKSVSAGELTASFDMGHNAKLPLGRSVPVGGQRSVTPIRIGAFASVGIAGVDAVVSQQLAREIGLVSRGGVLISAPKADPLTVRHAALQILGKHSRVEVLRQFVVTRDAGEFLTRAQISGFLHAAASRVGAPYVWGATGPNSFDCSGLVLWSFAQIGIHMPRVAAEQFFAGPHVPYRDARPGDLLFWHYDPTDPTDVDHVAIYVGNGQMIEAPHTGDVVKLVPVPRDHMAGVVRVDPALGSQIA
jgi:cell wall-associated NlpC family hydrolase